MPLIHHLPREYWVLAILVRLGNAPDEELLYQGKLKERCWIMYNEG